MKPKAPPDLRAVREKSLQELEAEAWEPPAYDSYLVQTIHRLRTVPLKQYGIEDLRIMIGQGIGLPYLIPIALEHLEQHPFAEGDYYRGDLLKMVTTVPADFWVARPSWRHSTAGRSRRPSPASTRSTRCRGWPASSGPLWTRSGRRLPCALTTR
jgi:hypothetical protein